MSDLDYCLEQLDVLQSEINRIEEAAELLQERYDEQCVEITQMKELLTTYAVKHPLNSTQSVTKPVANVIYSTTTDEMSYILNQICTNSVNYIKQERNQMDKDTQSEIDLLQCEINRLEDNVDVLQDDVNVLTASNSILEDKVVFLMKKAEELDAGMRQLVQTLDALRGTSQSQKAGNSNQQIIAKNKYTARPISDDMSEYWIK